MPTLLEISNDLAKTFVRSKNKKLAAKRIADHINCLQYSGSKHPIDYEIKEAVVQVISELISGIRPISIYGNEKIFVTTSDVSNFNKLSGKILQMVQANYAEKEVEIELKKPGILLHTFSFSFYNVNSYVAEIGKYFKIKKQQ